MKNTRPPAAPLFQDNTALIADSFERIMSTVFEQTHIDIPPEARKSAYTIRINQATDLHFFPDADGNINIIGHAGRLPAPVSQECLLQLLALNIFFPVTPNVSVAIDRSNDNIQVWTRQRMEAVEEKGAIRLLKLMMNAIGQVKDILASKQAPLSSSSHALQRRS